MVVLEQNANAAAVRSRAKPAAGAVTARAVIIGLLLVPVDNYLIIHMELVRDVLPPSSRCCLRSLPSSSL